MLSHGKAFLSPVEHKFGKELLTTSMMGKEGTPPKGFFPLKSRASVTAIPSVSASVPPVWGKGKKGRTARLKDGVS